MLRSRRMTDFLERAALQGPDVAHFRLGREHAFLVSRPELVRELFVTLGRQTAKGRGLEQSRRVLGQGLLTSEGELHRTQRRLVQPAFHARRIDAYAEVMLAEAEALGGTWTDGGTRDVWADMADLTFRIVGRTLFAADVAAAGPVVAHALTELLSRFQRVMTPGGPLLNRLPIPSTLRLNAAIAQLDDVVYGLIRSRRESGTRGDDVLSMLLEARNEDGTVMPDRQVRDEVLTLLLAGHETTANALSWTWLLLDANPAAAAWLHEELDAGTEDLPRTRAVIAESMRLYPPAWVVGRRMLADVTLGGWDVPAGSIVAGSQWITHRDARWWPDPLEFRPERWIAGGAFDEAAPGQPRGAYFPFGIGRRVCVGESFAWTEGVLVLATLARRWAPRLVPGTPVDVRPGVTLRPATGLPMILERRP
jgi:cytochrome P450